MTGTPSADVPTAPAGPTVVTMKLVLFAIISLGIWFALPAADRAWSAQIATSEQLAVLDEILARPEFRAAEGRGVLDTLLDPVRSAARAVLREVARALGRLAEA